MEIPSAAKGQSWVGVVRNRTLLGNNLLSVSDFLETVAGFQLLGPKASNIPVDSNGLLRPSETKVLIKNL